MKARILVCLLLIVSLLAPKASYARWMNPSTGRFHTMDTFEGRQTDPPSLHKYLYAEANPVENSDPSGLEVALQDHLVRDRKYHSLLRITPENQRRWSSDPRFPNRDEQRRAYCTIGAGPNYQLFLVSNLNRNSDVGPHPNSIPLSIPSRYANEDTLIERLLQYDANYCDQLTYEPFPKQGIGTYNSNSYISGLLDAVHVEKPSRPREVPGWQVPVPPAYFYGYRPEVYHYDHSFGDQLFSVFQMFCPISLNW